MTQSRDSKPVTLVPACQPCIILARLQNDHCGILVWIPRFHHLQLVDRVPAFSEHIISQKWSDKEWMQSNIDKGGDNYNQGPEWLAWAIKKQRIVWAQNFLLRRSVMFPHLFSLDEAQLNWGDQLIGDLEACTPQMVKMYMGLCSTRGRVSTWESMNKRLYQTLCIINQLHDLPPTKTRVGMVPSPLKIQL